MIKNLLPFEELVYQSTLKKEELLIKLQNEIEEKKSSGFGSNKFSYTKPYFGEIRADKFEIMRATKYRNSFIPTIKGEIVDHVSGSKINVKMSLSNFVKVFMIIWFSIVFISCLGTAYGLIITGDINLEGGLFVFIPFFMLIAGLTMVYYGFKTESKKSKIDLEGILQAKIIEQ